MLAACGASLRKETRGCTHIGSRATAVHAGPARSVATERAAARTTFAEELESDVWADFASEPLGVLLAERGAPVGVAGTQGICKLRCSFAPHRDESRLSTSRLATILERPVDDLRSRDVELLSLLNGLQKFWLLADGALEAVFGRAHFPQPEAFGQRALVDHCLDFEILRGLGGVLERCPELCEFIDCSTLRSGQLWIKYGVRRLRAALARLVVSLRNRSRSAAT